MLAYQLFGHFSDGFLEHVMICMGRRGGGKAMEIHGGGIKR